MRTVIHIKRPCSAPECENLFEGSKSTVCEFHRGWTNCVYPNCENLRRGRNVLCSFHILKKRGPSKPRKYSYDPAKNKEYYAKHKDEINAKTRQMRQENPEKNKKKCLEYRAKNIEAVRKKDRERSKNRSFARKLTAHLYRERNKERLKIYFSDYGRKNRQKRNHFHSCRRALKANAKGKHSFIQWLRKLDYYGWRCYHCKCVLTDKTATKDHAIPLSRGGSNWLSNVLPSCSECNSRKNNKTVVEFSFYKQQLAKAV